MRWKEPNGGDKRTIKKFLIFPKKLCGEIRWLEFVTIEQIYDAYWKDYEWIDRKKSINGTRVNPITTPCPEPPPKQY